MVQGDVTAHGVTHEGDGGCLEGPQECFQIMIECSHGEFLGVVRTPVPPEIEGHHVVLAAKQCGEVVPPVGIRPTSVKENHGRLGCVPPTQ